MKSICCMTDSTQMSPPFPQYIQNISSAGLRSRDGIWGASLAGGWIISKKYIFFGFSVHIWAFILYIGSPSQVKRLFRMSIRFKPHRNIRKLTLTFNNPLRKTQKLFTYVVAITFFHDVKCADTASLDHKIPIKTHNCALFNTCNSKRNYYTWNICTYLNLLCTFISVISNDNSSRNSSRPRF